MRRKQAEIAQLVEHDLAKVGVAGSSPVFRSTKFFDTHCGNSSVVEHHLAKVGVAGPNPVFRSRGHDRRCDRDRNPKESGFCLFCLPGELTLPAGYEARIGFLSFLFAGGIVFSCGV